MDTEAHLDGVIDMISEERDLLQAKIASLTTENKRLTNENWRFQMGEAVMLKPHLNLIGRLKAENERLRYHLDGMLNIICENYHGKIRDDDRANIDAARAAIQSKESNQ